MEYLPFIFFVLFVLCVFGLFIWNVLQNRKTDRWIAGVKAEAEYQKWYTERRANMTNEQLEDEQAYYKLLQNTPIEQRYNNTYRTGSSLSKDLIGFDLLPK